MWKIVLVSVLMSYNGDKPHIEAVQTQEFTSIEACEQHEDTYYTKFNNKQAIVVSNCTLQIQ